MPRPPLYPDPGPVLDRIYDALPAHYEDADESQREPGPLPELAAAVNLFPNPVFANQAGANPYSGASLVWRPADPAYPDGQVLRLGSFPINGGLAVMLYPVAWTPGEVSSWSVSIRGVNLAAPRPLGTAVGAYNGGSGVGGHNVQDITVTNDWTEHRLVATSGLESMGNASINQIGLQFISPGGWAPGETIEIRYVAAYRGTVAYPFFYGGSAQQYDARYGDAWSWDGVPHNSASRQAARAEDLGGYPMYRWLAGIVSQLGRVDGLLERFDVDPTDPATPGALSQLADPLTADEEWLPWLAQLVSVRLDPALDAVEARDAVRFASAGWRAGTKTAVADAARSALTGTRFARVYDHSIVDPGDGGPWDVLIITRNTETPNPAAVLEAVVRRGAKPVGVVLHFRTYESTWGTITSIYPTWASRAADPSWNAIEEAGLT